MPAALDSARLMQDCALKMGCLQLNPYSYLVLMGSLVLGFVVLAHQCLEVWVPCG